MKKFILAAALALLTLPAVAQNAIDVGGAIPGAANFAALQETRQIINVPFTGVTAATSYRIPVIMDGEIKEIRATTEGGFGAGSMWVNVSISTRNSAVVRPIGTIRLGLPGNLFNEGLLLNGIGTVREGDSIIVNVTAGNSGTHVVLRIAN